MTPEERLRALAFNAVAPALDGHFLPLSARQRVADSVLAVALAEVDALIRNDALYLPWSAEYQKLEPESYAFRPWRDALAEFVAAHLGGKVPVPTGGEPDVVADIRRCRETTEEQS